MVSGPMPVGIPFPKYYDFFMDWKTPLAIGATYVITVNLFNPKVGKVSRVVAKSTNAKPAEKTESSATMTAFVFVHNLLLSIYSGVTFYHTFPALIESYRTHNLYDAFCDIDRSFWNNALGYWGYIFYLSKFYEVIDTIIIILKGRRSSLLQTYHHAGAMITMWSGIKYQASPIWIFVIFNSFIHTIMYCYYACTSIGLHPPGKKYLTTMQITQFLLGTSLAFLYFFVPGCIRSRGAQMAFWINIGYIFPLTYLFVDFAKRTYSKRGAVAAQNTMKIQ
ncbi:hypothetical protein BGX21_007828 [Mortierella sp. AD011]|nr:hypothetical protein BGX20_007421 [Mortierella sp. AD010]KAF9398405.1 hypothetical protein BGX21_007828 [Mortierella sp. AD011]